MSIDIPKMFRAQSRCHRRKGCTIGSHAHRDCIRRLGKMAPRPVSCLTSLRDIWEVLQMCGPLLALLPLRLDRGAVRRIGCLLRNGQAIGMGVETLRYRFAGVIACSILHHHEVRCGVRQPVQPEGGAGERTRERPPAEEKG